MSDQEAGPYGFAGGIHQTLDISVVEASAERVVLSMPVGSPVHQPYGILHGGVSALLAESAASMGGAMNAGTDKGVVGIELNASHLRPVRDGVVTATATPIRVGRTVQVWNIDIRDAHGRQVCAARCSLAVIDRPET